MPSALQNQRAAGASERDGAPHLFLFDFTSNTETQLTTAAVGDYAPRVSPDGKSIAFVRDGKELRVLDLASSRTGCWRRGPAQADVDAVNGEG